MTVSGLALVYVCCGGWSDGASALSFGRVAVPLPVFLQRAEYMETEKQMKYV
jgi:hypothetical protein